MLTHDAKTFDVAVVGGGPAGLICALLLGHAGIKTALIRKVMPPQINGRTVALMQGALTLLEQVGVLPALADKSAPLQTMRLIDATKSFLRAPTVLFKAEEANLDSFGANMTNADLVAVLENALPHFTSVQVFDAQVDSIEIETQFVRLHTNGIIIETKLVAAADGHASKLRDAAGIKTTQWSYPQKAVTALLQHTAPHKNISTEFHTNFGLCTFVPLPENVSSLVLVTQPDDAESLMQLADDDFCIEVERRCESLLGQFKLASTRACWPLQGQLPECFAATRIALVGEAAPVLPPIGAQGLNLGFRDAAMLAQLSKQALADGSDPGAQSLMQAYHKGRQADVRLRTYGVDLFNRSLLAPFLPVHMARGFGLYLAGITPLFRKILMRAGLAA